MRSILRNFSANKSKSLLCRSKAQDLKWSTHRISTRVQVKSFIASTSVYQFVQILINWHSIYTHFVRNWLSPVAEGGESPHERRMGVLGQKIWEILIMSLWGAGHWGFAESGNRAILGAEIWKSINFSADCRNWLHFLQNAEICPKITILAKSGWFDAKYRQQIVQSRRKTPQKALGQTHIVRVHREQ